MPGPLLDSSVLIAALRGQEDALGFIPTSPADEAYISVVSRAEVLAGMRPHEETDTMELLSTLTPLPVDVATADEAGRLIYRYARKGVQIGLPDALIGATCITNQLTLVTTNAKHFPMLPADDIETLPTG